MVSQKSLPEEICVCWNKKDFVKEHTVELSDCHRSVDIAKELRAFENIDVYIVGGKMRQSGSVVDSFANDFVSRRRYLLLPGAKIGTDSFVKVCDIGVFDEIITDWDCMEEQITVFEEKGVSVTIVEEAK